jgi:DNA-binding response OmpR family regulator
VRETRAQSARRTVTHRPIGRNAAFSTLGPQDSDSRATSMGQLMTNHEPGRKSVLCVDDDTETRALLKLAMPDFDVVFASSAFEAIRAINARAFDAYVLDYWLSDWAGPALCRDIRKLDPHAPIVFCTNAARDQDRGRALRAGANAYLVKPIDAQAFRAQLRGLLALVDAESLHAKIAEEQAIQHELQRRVDHLRERAAAANRMSAQSFERIARIKAYKAFMDGRGTRAHFDRWWPQVFQSAQANHAPE